MKGSNMIKKLFVTAALTAGMTLSLAAQDSSVVKEFTSFNDISIKGVSSFSIIEGDNYSLEITGDKANVDAVVVSNEEGFLQLTSDAERTVDLIIMAPSFKTLAIAENSYGSITSFNLENTLALYLSDDSALNIKGELKAPQIEVMASKSKLNGAVNTGLMMVTTYSKADLDLNGTASALNVEMHGNSTASFENLFVSNAKIDTQQTASMTADFPGYTKVAVDTSGESTVTLNMTGLLSAKVLSDSSLIYSGDVNWMTKYVSNGENDDAFIRMN